MDGSTKTLHEGGQLQAAPSNFVFQEEQVHCFTSISVALHIGSGGLQNKWYDVHGSHSCYRPLNMKHETILIFMVEGMSIALLCNTSIAVPSILDHCLVHLYSSILILLITVMLLKPVY